MPCAPTGSPESVPRSGAPDVDVVSGPMLPVANARKYGRFMIRSDTTCECWRWSCCASRAQWSATAAGGSARSAMSQAPVESSDQSHLRRRTGRCICHNPAPRQIVMVEHMRGREASKVSKCCSSIDRVVCCLRSQAYLLHCVDVGWSPDDKRDAKATARLIMNVMTSAGIAYFAQCCCFLTSFTPAVCRQLRPDADCSCRVHVLVCHPLLSCILQATVRECARRRTLLEKSRRSRVCRPPDRPCVRGITIISVSCLHGFVSHV